MVNTLVLSVFERTREIGMLRAIGMTRRQARRMIRQESVITALIGAALGLGLGVFLAALVTQALSEYDIGLSVPVATLLALHAGRGARRDRRGDHAGPPGLAAERAGRAALRVGRGTPRVPAVPPPHAAGRRRASGAPPPPSPGIAARASGGTSGRPGRSSRARTARRSTRGSCGRCAGGGRSRTARSGSRSSPPMMARIGLRSPPGAAATDHRAGGRGRLSGVVAARQRPRRRPSVPAG